MPVCPGEMSCEPSNDVRNEHPSFCRSSVSYLFHFSNETVCPLPHRVIHGERVESDTLLIRFSLALHIFVIFAF